jgi:hypothetical protein
MSDVIAHTGVKWQYIHTNTCINIDTIYGITVGHPYEGRLKIVSITVSSSFEIILVYIKQNVTLKKVIQIISPSNGPRFSIRVPITYLRRLQLLTTTHSNVPLVNVIIPIVISKINKRRKGLLCCINIFETILYANTIPKMKLYYLGIVKQRLHMSKNAEMALDKAQVEIEEKKEILEAAEILCMLR